MRMQARSFVLWSIRVLFVLLVMASSTWAQFTGNIQGTVSDPSSAAVAQAKVDLVNVVTKVSATTTTDASGTPGSGVDNFSTETAVDVSANGQGTVSNMWIVDGLDVTSSIRQGVLNLTPNPDVVQEASNQVNTFAVDYGHSSSVQFAVTTK